MRSFGRRSIRLAGYDYRQPGAYFVTVCSWRRLPLFGDNRGDFVTLNRFGEIVVEEWQRTRVVRPSVDLDVFVAMPDHIRGIVVILDGPAQKRPMRPRGAPSGSLGAVVGQFKTVAAKRINRERQSPGAPVWQRNYYERVIRNERELQEFREYIAANAIKHTMSRRRP